MTLPFACLNDLMPSTQDPHCGRLLQEGDKGSSGAAPCRAPAASPAAPTAAAPPSRSRPAAGCWGPASCGTPAPAAQYWTPCSRPGCCASNHRNTPAGPDAGVGSIVSFRRTAAWRACRLRRAGRRRRWRVALLAGWCPPAPAPCAPAGTSCSALGTGRTSVTRCAIISCDTRITALDSRRAGWRLSQPMMRVRREWCGGPPRSRGAGARAWHALRLSSPPRWPPAPSAAHGAV